MKNLLFMLFTLLILSGCTTKIEVDKIDPTIKSELRGKSIHTYSLDDAAIISYYFENEIKEEVRYDITYLPIYPYQDLYSLSSNIRMFLLGVYKKHNLTIEDALMIEVKKKGNKKIFTNKEQYIIDTWFANKLKTEIYYFEKLQEDRIYITEP